jgi:hypothetical protein
LSRDLRTFSVSDVEYPGEVLEVVGKFCGLAVFGVVLLSRRNEANKLLLEALPCDDPGDVIGGCGWRLEKKWDVDGFRPEVDGEPLSLSKKFSSAHAEKLCGGRVGN